MSELATKFHDLPANCYPFMIRGYREDTGELVWEETINGPVALYVPPLAKEHGAPIAIETAYATGIIGYVDAEGVYHKGPYKVPAER